MIFYSDDDEKFYNNDGEKIKESPKPKAHICPICGKREISYVTEYHKCFWERVLCAVFTMLFWVCFALVIIKTVDGLIIGKAIEIDTEFLFPAIVFLLGNLFGKISIIRQESKTHAQAICKTCGHIWFIT